MAASVKLVVWWYFTVKMPKSTAATCIRQTDFRLGDVEIVSDAAEAAIQKPHPHVHKKPR